MNLRKTQKSLKEPFKARSALFRTRTYQTLGDDAHLTDDSTTQPGTGPNTGEGTSTTPNNNGAGTHQPSNTQANGTENELSRTGVAVTGVAGIMMLLALAGISLNLWKVRR